MKYIFICFLATFWLFSQKSTAQFSWAHTGGGLGHHDHSRAVGRDTDGNCYIAGTYRDTLIIDGTTLPTWPNLANTQASFIVKLNAAGQLQWAKALRANDGAATAPCEITAMATSDNGQTTVFGSFTDSLTLGSQTIVTTFNGFGEHSMFGARFDAAGNLLWLKLFSARKVTPVRAVALSDGGVVLSGYFTQQLDLGPSHSLTASGSADRVAFVTRLDASGNVEWAQRTQGKKEDRLTGMVVGANKVHISAIFRDSTRFSPTVAFGVRSPESNSSNRRNMYVATYDLNSGNFEWAQQISGQLDWSSDIELQQNGLIVIGIASGYLRIGTDSTSAGTFVASLDLSNGQQQWVKKSSKFINRLKALGPDEFMVFGNAGSGAWSIDTLVTAHLSSGFYWATLDKNGHALRYEAFGDGGLSMGVNDIFVKDSTYLMGGSLYGLGSVTLGSGVVISPAETGYHNLWFGLFGGSGGGGSTSVNENEAYLNSIRVYPNPATQYMVLEPLLEEVYQYSLINLQGQTVQSGKALGKETLDLQAFQAGLYVLKLEYRGQQQFRKLVIGR